jgi:hypothetical protein
MVGAGWAPLPVPPLEPATTPAPPTPPAPPTQLANPPATPPAEAAAPVETPPPAVPPVPPVPPVPLIAPRPADVSAAPSRCAPRFYTFGRGVAAGALGGAGVAALATAIGLTAADGSVYTSRADGYPGDVTWNFRPHYQIAYTLSALSALGLGAVLYDWRKLSGKRAEPAPRALCEAPRGKWTFNRGLAIGALGTLLFTGLLSSAALTALDGGSYVSSDPAVIDTPVPYHFRTAYSVGYAASAGLLVGLGLAIFLP